MHGDLVKKPAFITVAAAATLLLAACAASPTTTTPAPPIQAAAPTAKAPAANAVTVAATEGYTRVVKDGRELYCRPDEVLGSRVSREVCRTAAELENARRNSDDYMRGVQNAAGEPAIPTGPLGR